MLVECAELCYIEIYDFPHKKTDTEQQLLACTTHYIAGCGVMFIDFLVPSYIVDVMIHQQYSPSPPNP